MANDIFMNQVPVTEQAESAAVPDALDQQLENMMRDLANNGIEPDQPNLETNIEQTATQNIETMLAAEQMENAVEAQPQNVEVQNPNDFATRPEQDQTAKPEPQGTTVPEPKGVEQEQKETQTEKGEHPQDMEHHQGDDADRDPDKVEEQPQQDEIPDPDAVGAEEQDAMLGQEQAAAADAANIEPAGDAAIDQPDGEPPAQDNMLEDNPETADGSERMVADQNDNPESADSPEKAVASREADAETSDSAEKAVAAHENGDAAAAKEALITDAEDEMAASDDNDTNVVGKIRDALEEVGDPSRTATLEERLAQIEDGIGRKITSEEYASAMNDYMADHKDDDAATKSENTSNIMGDLMHYMFSDVEKFIDFCDNLKSGNFDAILDNWMSGELSDISKFADFANKCMQVIADHFDIELHGSERTTDFADAGLEKTGDKIDSILDFFENIGDLFRGILEHLKGSEEAVNIEQQATDMNAQPDNGLSQQDYVEQQGNRMDAQTDTPQQNADPDPSDRFNQADTMDKNNISNEAQQDPMSKEDLSHYESGNDVSIGDGDPQSIDDVSGGIDDAGAEAAVESGGEEAVIEEVAEMAAMA